MGFKLRFFLLVLLLLLVAAGGAAFVGLRWFQEYWATPQVLAQEVYVDIVPGMSAREAAERLAEQGVVRYPWAFYGYLRWSGQAGAIQAGEYAFQGAMTPARALDMLLQGEVERYAFHIIPGVRVSSVLAKLREKEETLNLTGFPVPGEEGSLAGYLGLPYPSIEGWLFPDSYEYRRGTSAREVLRAPYEKMEGFLQQEWAKRDPDVPLQTPYEALILASIVEKETGLTKERTKVAAVYLNRLRKGMHLQSDPTVIYGMGSGFGGRLLYSHLKVDTPHNTYVHTGLPPTPIAIPSAESIQAVLHPASIEALFFVATGRGGHTFSNTYKEHLRAVRAFRRCRDQGNCGGS